MQVQEQEEKEELQRNSFELLLFNFVYQPNSSFQCLQGLKKTDQTDIGHLSIGDHDDNTMGECLNLVTKTPEIYVLC